MHGPGNTTEGSVRYVQNSPKRVSMNLVTSRDKKGGARKALEAYVLSQYLQILVLIRDGSNFQNCDTKITLCLVGSPTSCYSHRKLINIVPFYYYLSGLF